MCVLMCIMYVLSVCVSQKMTLEQLELETLTVLNHHDGARN